VPGTGGCEEAHGSALLFPDETPQGHVRRRIPRRQGRVGRGFGDLRDGGQTSSETEKEGEHVGLGPHSHPGPETEPESRRVGEVELLRSFARAELLRCLVRSVPSPPSIARVESQAAEEGERFRGDGLRKVAAGRFQSLEARQSGAGRRPPSDEIQQAGLGPTKRQAPRDERFRVHDGRRLPATGGDGARAECGPLGPARVDGSVSRDLSCLFPGLAVHGR